MLHLSFQLCNVLEYKFLLNSGDKFVCTSAVGVATARWVWPLKKKLHDLLLFIYLLLKADLTSSLLMTKNSHTAPAHNGEHSRAFRSQRVETKIEAKMKVNTEFVRWSQT